MTSLYNATSQLEGQLQALLQIETEYIKSTTTNMADYILFNSRDKGVKSSFVNAIRSLERLRTKVNQQVWRSQQMHRSVAHVNVLNTKKS